jgi:hypothetical protein
MCVPLDLALGSLVKYNLEICDTFVCGTAFAGIKPNSCLQIEWDAPETESHVDVHVESLEGSGNFHLKTEIIGTTQHMAAEAVLNHPPTSLVVNCHWYDDCTYHYNEEEMRADGASFLLRCANKINGVAICGAGILHSDTVCIVRRSFPAASGLTYQFSTMLKPSLQNGTHLRMAIFPPDSIGTASTDSGKPGQTESHSCSEAVAGAEGGALDDVIEMPLGSW